MTPVRLSAIVDGMEMQSDTMIAHLHRPTGKVVIVSEEALTAAEEDDEDSVTPEELADARGILAGDDYIALPDRFEIDEYRMMERFAASIEDDRQSNELLAALRGHGAFRRFKDAVHRLHLSEAWYAFRDRAYNEVARAWCEANAIELDSHADA